MPGTTNSVSLPNPFFPSQQCKGTKEGIFFSLLKKTEEYTDTAWGRGGY